MHGLVGDTTFADTRRELAVVATELRAGHRLIIRDGGLVDATLASAAIPGIGSPVEFGDWVLIDGGFADPAPVDVARDLGAEVVMAVYTGQFHERVEVDNWMSGLWRGFEVGQRAFAEERLRHADFVLRPDFGERVNALNFNAAEQVVRCGARSARDATDDLLKLVKET
jgi:NTE family protein